MKIKKGFVLREIADTIVVVPTGELINDFQGMITLTKSAKFVWELLQEDISEDEIVDQLVKRYKIDVNRAKEDTKKFLQQLRDANVFET